MGIFNLLFYATFCFTLSVVLVYSRSLFFGVVRSQEVLSSYECGFEPLSPSHTPFCIKFFLLAILFIVFDVEVAFIVPSLFSSLLIWSFVLLLLFGVFLSQLGLLCLSSYLTVWFFLVLATLCTCG